MLDLLLGVALLGYAVLGYRFGLLVSVLSAVGFVVGGGLGVWAAPLILRQWPQLDQPPLLGVVVSLLVILTGASLVQGLAVLIGRRLRSERGPLRVIDSLLGAVAVATVTALAVWLLAGVVRPASPPPLARAIGDSRIVQSLDRVVPNSLGVQAAEVVVGLRSVLDRSGFPQVFDGLSPEPITPVPPPDPEVARTPAVLAAAGSVLKVTGNAYSCNRAQEGSAFVVQDDSGRRRVVTNAHVVAGIEDVRVQLRGQGPRLSAQVVAFDPSRDLAVLQVPDLPGSASALPLGAGARSGQQAVALGFPENGPYRESSARVRSELTAVGADIYGRPGASREVYSLYADVRPGNSGGPLIGTDGRLLGVIFAKSLDDTKTGYALTLDELRPVLASAGEAEVSTGRCSNG